MPDPFPHLKRPSPASNLSINEGMLTIHNSNNFYNNHESSLSMYKTVIKPKETGDEQWGRPGLMKWYSKSSSSSSSSSSSVHVDSFDGLDKTHSLMATVMICVSSESMYM